MRKLFFLLVSILVISCSNEGIPTEEITDQNQTLVSKFYFKGTFYTIEYYEDADGNLQPLSDIPDALKGLDNLPELATVINKEAVYFFENEQEKFNFYNDDYEKLLESRKNASNFDSKNPAIVGPFNTYVKFYQDSYLKGNIMTNINSVDDLKNLKSVNFNDKASSCTISSTFKYPYGTTNYNQTRRVIMYEHADFKGKSIEISNYYISPGIFGHERFKSLSSALFSNWDDKISSIDIVLNGVSEVK
ncbi:hypothetical protein [Flagellimonas sediminis]|uniref:Lipoprotein n=1 Tax=Flagellimonas sediminis TaxID=2696468 RepID=A0A6I5KSG3_9FLAO|nr:hypothetical protein [Allomuricauda sediminis]NDV43383.1 hypothetical protein [Allomuricauda sediminis]